MVYYKIQTKVRVDMEAARHGILEYIWRDVVQSDGTPYRYESRHEAERMRGLCFDADITTTRVVGVYNGKNAD